MQNLNFNDAQSNISPIVVPTTSSPPMSAIAMASGNQCDNSIYDTNINRSNDPQDFDFGNYFHQ